MMFRHTTAAMVLGASTLLSAAIYGQQNPQPGQPAQPGRPAAPNQTNPAPRTTTNAPMTVQVNEQSMAACLAIANQEEIAIGQFAVEHAQKSDVKQFAKMIVEDHQAFLKKLQKFTPVAREESLAQGTAAAAQVQPAGGATQSQTGATIQQTAGQANDGRQPAAVDMIQLHREMAQQCLADSKKKMTEKDKDHFDVCFIGHQLAKHEAMKTHLTVLQRHASGEFAQLLAEGIKTTDNHLKQAEKLMEDLAHHNSRDSKSDKSDRSEKSGEKSDRSRDK